MSSRQFGFYEFRLYTTFAVSFIVGVLSCLNLNAIVKIMRDFIQSGQSPQVYQDSTQTNIKNLEREFITFFSLTAFSLAIFVLTGSQIFRVEEGDIFQNLYNEFTFLIVVSALIGILCYTISVYKNISNGIVKAPVTLINVCLLVILFFVLFAACYRFFGSADRTQFNQSASYYVPEKTKSTGSGILQFLRGPSQKQKLQRERQRLREQQQLHALRSQISSRGKALAAAKQHLASGSDNTSTVSSLTKPTFQKPSSTNRKNQGSSHTSVSPYGSLTPQVYD